MYLFIFFLFFLFMRDQILFFTRILLEVLLAVVELPQLLLLLLLKVRMHLQIGVLRGLLLLFVIVCWVTQLVAVVDCT